MALTTCPDCGKQVSSQAPSCPTCGRPISAGASPASSMNVGTEKPIELTAKRFKLISMISFLAVVLGFIFIGVGNTDPGETSASASFGLILVLLGGASYIINRIRIWWHHK